MESEPMLTPREAQRWSHRYNWRWKKPMGKAESNPGSVALKVQNKHKHTMKSPLTNLCLHIEVVFFLVWWRTEGLITHRPRVKCITILLKNKTTFFFFLNSIAKECLAHPSYPPLLSVASMSASALIKSSTMPSMARRAARISGVVPQYIRAFRLVERFRSRICNTHTHTHRHRHTHRHTHIDTHTNTHTHTHTHRHAPSHTHTHTHFLM